MISVDFFVVRTAVFQIDRIDGKTDRRQMSDASNLAGLIVLENRRKGSPTSDNTPLKIKRTGKVTKIESEYALRGLKFDTEIV